MRNHISYIEVTGNLEPGVKYLCYPEDEYAELKAENEVLTKLLASHRICDSCKEPMIPRTTCKRCQRLWES